MHAAHLHIAPLTARYTFRIAGGRAVLSMDTNAMSIYNY